MESALPELENAVDRRAALSDQGLQTGQAGKRGGGEFEVVESPGNVGEEGPLPLLHAEKSVSAEGLHEALDGGLTEGRRNIGP
jgi:hypothetical protein